MVGHPDIGYKWFQIVFLEGDIRSDIYLKYLGKTLWLPISIIIPCSYPTYKKQMRDECPRSYQRALILKSFTLMVCIWSMRLSERPCVKYICTFPQNPLPQMNELFMWIYVPLTVHLSLSDGTHYGVSIHTQPWIMTYISSFAQVNKCYEITLLLKNTWKLRLASKLRYAENAKKSCAANYKHIWRYLILQIIEKQILLKFSTSDKCVNSHEDALGSSRTCRLENMSKFINLVKVKKDNYLQESTFHFANKFTGE